MYSHKRDIVCSFGGVLRMLQAVSSFIAERCNSRSSHTAASAQRNTKPFVETTAASNLSMSTLSGSSLLIKPSSLEAGDILGSGTFCSVFEVRRKVQLEGEQSAPPMNLALKRVRPDSLAQKAALRDILWEAEFLSKTPRHKNIIRLHGLSDDFWVSPAEGFLVLERVTETLCDRLEIWRNDMPKTSFFGRRKDAAKSPSTEPSRIASSALGIARALEFLHSRNIVYRDIKPANAGYGLDGQIRLFDFGLARRVPEDRKLTQGAGTMRYMAPEVALGHNYGLPADVHSFSILLWQICALRLPYANAASIEGLEHMSINCKIRPVLNRVKTPATRSLLKRGWDVVPSKRPSFDEVVAILADVCSDLPKS